MAYKHGQIYKRTNIVSTVYKPVSENMDWYAQEYDAKTFKDMDINDVNISLNTLKAVLKKAIFMAKDEEDKKIRTLRSFLKKVSANEARFNSLVDSWSPKELIYYAYRYNNMELANFNRLLAEEKGLKVSFDFATGLAVNVLLDNKIASKVSFQNEKTFNFFVDRMMEGETGRAKGILFEEYTKNFTIPATFENTQEGEIKKVILKESIGSDMGVVDFMYTGLEELIKDGNIMYSGKHELLPVDIKFSARRDMIMSIFKGIHAGRILLKLGGELPSEFKGMDTFKRVFTEWLKQEASKALLEEADARAPGLGAQKLKASLNLALNNKNSSVTKALSISMVLYKIVNNITETLRGNVFSNEFPVFVQNPGLYNGITEKRVISDILFSSEILDSLYASLFDGEHVLNKIPEYGFVDNINASIATRQMRADSFNKAIASSGADIPVRLGDRPLAVVRHKAAIQGVLNRVVFELNYGKIGG
jgi:hypothetical protein